MTITALTKILKEAWSKETSAFPKTWTSNNPAWGQCFVTALIVQDFFGGEILRTVAIGFGSHYFNRLPNGQEVDLTRSQFPPGVQILPAVAWQRNIEVMERNVDGYTRYKLLKDRVWKIITIQK